MSTKRFLEYEVTLLLAKYGKSALLSVLAEKLHLTADQLEEILERVPNEKPALRSGSKPSTLELVGQLAQEQPKKAQLLRTLQSRLENRTFLPELRDVKRFFDRHARPLGAAKSRADSLPRVLKLLAELDVAELEALCHTAPENEYSSLAVISEAILRRHNPRSSAQ